MGLSSFYAFGKQGAVFFAGAACGLLLVEASGHMLGGSVLFCVATLAIEWSLVGSMRGRATYAFNLTHAIPAPSCPRLCCFSIKR